MQIEPNCGREDVVDTLLLGFYDTEFRSVEKTVRGMGVKSGAYRDLRLAFVTREGAPLRCLELLNAIQDEDTTKAHAPYDNCDFLWPALLYLGTYLAKRGFSFDYLNLIHRNKELLLEKLRTQRHRTVVITTTLYVTPQPIIELVRMIRSVNTEVTIIVGGPYIANQATALSERDLGMLYSYLGGDIYVNSNEGESTLAAVLQALKTNQALDEIPNVGFKKGAKFQINLAIKEKNELEEELVDYGLFAKDIGQFVSTRTAKSCPFACAFCGFPGRAGKYRYMAVEHIERELDAIASVGTVSTVTFLDDTFNVPKGRFKDILELIIRKKYGFKWNSFYRSDVGDSETIELMARAGCEGVFLGIESGSDRMLAAMNKTARRADYEGAIRDFRRVGISTYASLIVGYPGETAESVLETKDFIESSRPDFYRSQLFYLDTATPVWREREKYGISGSGFAWSHSTMSAEMASEIVEWMFLTVKNSTWMPQNGFEQWSTFYLQRRGFSRQGVTDFVRGFNAAIKAEILLGKPLEEQVGVLDYLRSVVAGRSASDLDLSAIRHIEQLATRHPMPVPPLGVAA